MVSSNSVSTSIQPALVQVGGHLWIDKNDNGVWETGESLNDLQNYEIINKLEDNIKIKLLRYEDETEQRRDRRLSYRGQLHFQRIGLCNAPGKYPGSRR